MTSEHLGEEMSEAEVVSLLESQGHGVLSLGSDDRGYGVPISYAYDPATERVVMEFINIGESKKQAFVESAEEATLTVYNYEDADAWESVVVTGPVHPIDPEEVSDRSAAKFFAQADDVAGDLRWTDSEDVDRRWYEIRQTDVSGRHGGELPHRQTGGLVRFSGLDRTY